MDKSWNCENFRMSKMWARTEWILSGVKITGFRRLPLSTRFQKSRPTKSDDSYLLFWDDKKTSLHVPMDWDVRSFPCDSRASWVSSLCGCFCGECWTGCGNVFVPGRTGLAQQVSADSLRPEFLLVVQSNNPLGFRVMPDVRVKLLIAPIFTFKSVLVGWQIIWLP